MTIVGAGLGGWPSRGACTASPCTSATRTRSPPVRATGSTSIRRPTTSCGTACPRLYRETSGLPGGPPLLMTEQLTFRQVLTAGLGRIIHYGMRRSMALGWQEFRDDPDRADGPAGGRARAEPGLAPGAR
ncbi:hypothetical protein [Amycolatopsis sp. NPDC006125]|uniref:hypothetical protein n=1 Tax=Amycolatopsis sp. NPDC006125 TaxID=3156730 RepID=UPI0033B756EB